MEDEYKVVCALSNGATFDDLEWPQTPVSRSQYSLKASRKRCIRSTPCVVLGKGFRGRRIERRYFRFHNIQDGGWRPSWNSRHLGMTALLSRSCICWEQVRGRSWCRHDCMVIVILVKRVCVVCSSFTALQFSDVIIPPPGSLLFVR